MLNSILPSAKDRQPRIDKTPFIAALERLRKYYAFIARPAGFRKTSFTDSLAAYYDKCRAEQFQEAFAGTWIGAHPTPAQGAYAVLRFNFSGLDADRLVESFSEQLIHGFADFFDRYPMKDAETLLMANGRLPSQHLLQFFTAVRRSRKEKLFLVIDDCDSFLLELLAADPTRFRKVTGPDSFLINFYLQIKEATRTDFVARIFMTGCAPLPLDGITAGFSIASDLSNHPAFAGLFGFTPQELRPFVQQAVDDNRFSLTEGALTELLENHCGGYRFSTQSDVAVFHPSGCRHVLARLRESSEGEPAVDSTTDFGDQDSSLWLSLVETDIARSCLEAAANDRPLLFGGFASTLSLNNRDQLSRDDWLSLLFFLGLVTFSPEDSSHLICPNQIAKRRLSSLAKRQSL